MVLLPRGLPRPIFRNGLYSLFQRAHSLPLCRSIKIDMHRARFFRHLFKIGVVQSMQIIDSIALLLKTTEKVP